MSSELSTLMGVVALISGVQILWAARHDFNPDDDRLSRAARLRDGGTTSLPDYAVALFCFGIAAALMAHVVSAVVGYALLCTSIAARFSGNLFVEERVRRRRAAVLGRSRAVDPAIVAWIAIGALSTVLVVADLAASSDRAVTAAILACVIAMLAIACRIATAPPLLAGEDLEAELQIDRMRRIRRCGMVCVVAIGCASFYASAQAGTQTIALIGYAALIVVLPWVLISIKLASKSRASRGN